MSKDTISTFGPELSGDMEDQVSGAENEKADTFCVLLSKL